MQKQDDTQQAAELRLAFLRHLPKRLETLRKRGQRLCTQGWDINALSILFREVQTLAGACGRYALLDIGEHLFALEGFLAPFVERVAIPDAGQTAAFAAQLRELEPLIAATRTALRRADRDPVRCRTYGSERAGRPIRIASHAAAGILETLHARCQTGRHGDAASYSAARHSAQRSGRCTTDCCAQRSSRHTATYSGHGAYRSGETRRNHRTCRATSSGSHGRRRSGNTSDYTVAWR